MCICKKNYFPNYMLVLQNAKFEKRHVCHKIYIFSAPKVKKVIYSSAHTSLSSTKALAVDTFSDILYTR